MKQRSKKWSFKKAIVPLGAIASISLPAVIAVSCGDNKKEGFEYQPPRDARKFSTDYNFSSIWTSLTNYEDCTLLHWIDGDTFRYRKSDGTENNLRVESIDTPESHVKDNHGKWISTSGVEKEWADKATEFGKKEIPAGSTIRLVFQVGGTYGRDVASVFYGDHFENNYSVNIIKSGFALPFINSSSLVIVMDRVTNPLHYVGVPIADAFNDAILNKRGMYGMDPSNISKVHGTTNINSSKYVPSDPKNIYHYISDDFWKE